MLVNRFLPYALLAISQSVLAAEPPNAGRQMQQIPPAPIPQKATPKIDLEPATIAIPESESLKVNVKRLNITSAQAYTEADLFAVSGFEPGSQLSLADLRGMAARIANHYRRNGYFVAQAYLPEQDIKDGIVTIAVIEGRYGEITLRNQTNLSDDLANSRLAGLNKGDPITSVPLENRLLLLSDLPGVTVKSTLIPGASVGASDLLVDLLPGPSVSGSVDADNAGNRYTGENRLGATVYFNNLAGLGEVASLRLLTAGSGLNYARAAYQMQFGNATAGVAYSYLDYKLGREFDYLGAHGTAKIASIFGSYPLIRSRNSNLYAGLAFDYKTFEDRYDLTSTDVDRKVQVLMPSLYGDHRDGFGGGGFTTYALTWSTGNLDIQTPEIREIDARTARSNGHYNKLSFAAMRLQRVTDSFSLYAAINGQVASKNLDSSEKMELGGVYAVRAYPEGEAYADEGYVLALEGRLTLPKFTEQMPGEMQLIGFVDTGTVTVNRDPWFGSGSNRRTLSGAGGGLSWMRSNDFMVRTYYAHKLGNEEATSAPDKSGRFWIQAVKYF